MLNQFITAKLDFYCPPSAIFKMQDGIAFQSGVVAIM